MGQEVDCNADMENIPNHQNRVNWDGGGGGIRNKYEGG